MSCDWHWLELRTVRTGLWSRASYWQCPRCGQKEPVFGQELPDEDLIDAQLDRWLLLSIWAAAAVGGVCLATIKACA